MCSHQNATLHQVFLSECPLTSSVPIRVPLSECPLTSGVSYHYDPLHNLSPSECPIM
ncbi:unnamed protein product [Staurois parvus]|uniref:Uncharacterized protein n=1 Tax=Staurois parvus TaxID=386267 RepID=A0ABN9EJX9_9NEOB|nr:unnamed protein product [Staurois parvus]